MPPISKEHPLSFFLEMISIQPCIFKSSPICYYTLVTISHHVVFLQRAKQEGFLSFFFLFLVTKKVCLFVVTLVSELWKAKVLCL